MGKSRITALISVLIVFFAATVFFLQKNAEEGLVDSDREHYDVVKGYMQSEYTGAYSDFFEMAYVEELSDYNESFNQENNRIEADFIMKTQYKYPYRDPDTVPDVRNAHENGNMEEYKKLYDEVNAIHSSDYKLKIDAKVMKNSLKDVTLYLGTEDGEWILLDNGLKEYITEE